MATSKTKAMDPVVVTGKDTIEDFRIITNNNMNAAADAVNKLAETVYNITHSKDTKATWVNGTSKGPSAIKTDSYGEQYTAIDNIPVAGKSNSGVVNTDAQTFSGKKTFNDGIVSNSLKDEKGHTLIASDGYNALIGGSGSGFKAKYNLDGTFNGWELPQSWKNLLYSSDSIEASMQQYKEQMKELQEKETQLTDDLAAQYVTIVNGIAEVKEELQEQIDKEITNWFYEGDVTPSASVEPESEWTTTTDKLNHVGDTFTNDTQSWKYTVDSTGKVFSWVEISDTTEIKTLRAAMEAKATADGKITTYLGAPIDADYSEGDLWIATEADVTAGYLVDNSPVVAGYVYHCNMNRSDGGGTFSVNHWDATVKYTNDDSANKALNAISDINDDETFAISEKMSVLQEYYGICGVKDIVTFDEILNNENNSSSLHSLLADVTSVEDEGHEIDLTQFSNAWTALYSFLDKWGVFDETLESTKNFKRDDLLNLFNQYYKQEYAIKSLVEEFTAADIATAVVSNISVTASDYLNEAIEEGDTSISGGLVLTNLIGVKSIASASSKGTADNMIAGLDGTDSSVAFWAGGTYTNAVSEAKLAALSSDDREVSTLIRKDGSGHFANGNFKWDNTGDVELTGTITAASGNIGGWTIGTSTLTAASVVLSSNGIITVGNTSKKYVKIDGTTGTITTNSIVVVDGIIDDCVAIVSDDGTTSTMNSRFRKIDTSIIAMSNKFSDINLTLSSVSNKLAATDASFKSINTSIETLTSTVESVKNCCYDTTTSSASESDARLKDVVSSIDVNLDDLKKISKCKYTWKDKRDSNVHIGTIAQSVQEVFPELVSEVGNKGMLGVYYDRLAVIALAAIDKLNDKNKELESEIELLKEEINLLKSSK